MDILLWVIFLLVLGLVFALMALWMFTRSVAAKVEAGFPARGRMVDVTGGRLHVVEAGEGRPIVMIHGLSGSLSNFTHSTTEPLAGDFRVVAVDRPGCGHSERDSDERARLPEQARMIAEFLEREGIEKPLIVGHSLGGALALTLGLNHPERVGGLALLAPLAGVQSGAPDVFKGINIANPAMRRFVSETFAIPVGIQRGETVLNAVFAPDAPPQDFRTRGGGLLNMRPQAFYAASTDLHAVPMDMPEIAARYGELKMPVGVLFGDADAVLDCSTHMAALEEQIGGLHAEILPGTGHMLLMSEPDATERFIRTMAANIFPN